MNEDTGVKNRLETQLNFMRRRAEEAEGRLECLAFVGLALMFSVLGILFGVLLGWAIWCE